MPDYDLGTARGKIEIDASGATAGVGEANRAVGDLDGKTDKAAQTMGKAGLVIGGIGLAAVAGFGLAVNAAAGFEKGLSAIEAVSGASEAQMEGIRKKALQLGADTKFSAAEAAGAMEELVKAGLPLEAVMTGAADATVALAAAGEVELVEAATIAANAMNAFGLSAKDMPRVADLIAGAANASAIDVSDFGMSLSQAGAMANLVGLSFDDLSLAVAAMGNAGIKGSDAGTSLKTFLSNLQPTTEKQTTAMMELGLMTEDGGNKFFDAAGKVKSMTEVAGLLGDATKDLSDKEKTMALEMIFGSDAIRAAAIIANTGAEGMAGLAGAMGKVSAEDVAEKRMDNLAGSMEQLKGSVETVAIQVGSVLLPILKRFADFITELVNKFSNLSPGMQTFLVIAGLVVASLALLAGTALLAISGFLKASKAVREFKEAMQALEIAQKRAIIAEKARQVVTKIGTGIQLAFNAVMMANPIFLVIAALVALGVGLFILYKKFTPFREFIDSMWQLVQKAVDFIKKNWDLLLPIFLGPLGAIILIWRRFGDDIVKFIKAAIEAVLQFFIDLPENIAYWLGFALGKLIRFGIDAVTWAFETGPKIIAGILDFLKDLPGKVLGFLDATWDKLFQFGVDAIAKAKEIGTNVVSGVIDFIKDLPGKVWGFLVATWTKLVDAVTTTKEKAGELARGAVSGFVDFFQDLPGKVASILGDLKDKIIDAVTGVFGAAKDLGSKLWSGFKKGLFGSPHTKVEYAVWDMLDNVKKGTQDLAAHMKTIEGLRAGLPSADYQMALGIGSGALQPVVPQGSGVAADQANGAGVTIGELNINNPVGETSEESLTRSMQKLEYAGYFG